MIFEGFFSFEDLAEEKKEKSPDYYGRTAEKSQIALRREQIAMEKFKEAQEEMEKRTDLEPGSNHIVPLLKPSCHLSNQCWSNFYNHVRKVEGWTTKRRLTTAEEKRLYKEMRKGKVYFVDVIYNVPEKEKKVMKRCLEEAFEKAGSSGASLNNLNEKKVKIE